MDYSFCRRRNSFIWAYISAFTTIRIFLEFSHSKPPYSRAKSQADSKTSYETMNKNITRRKPTRQYLHVKNARGTAYSRRKFIIKMSRIHLHPVQIRLPQPNLVLHQKRKIVAISQSPIQHQPENYRLKYHQKLESFEKIFHNNLLVGKHRWKFNFHNGAGKYNGKSKKNKLNQIWDKKQ